MPASAARTARSHASSPIHALDPRLKLICAIIFMGSCLAVSNLSMLALAAAFIAGVFTLARAPLTRVLAHLKLVAYALVLTSLMNLVFVHTGEVLIAVGPLSITTGGITQALFYTVRFLLLLLAGTLLLLTTSPVALTDAVERLLAPLARLGLPVSEVTLILSIALRFVPVLSCDARTITIAQIARGAKLEGARLTDYLRAAAPVAVPLFASAVRHAEHLGQAMEARCYTGGAGRTHYHALHLTRRDGIAALIVAVYLVMLAVLGLR